MLRRFGVTWAFNVAALFVAAWVVDGIGYGDKAWTLFGAALVFSLVNMLVKPFVKLLALPLIIITLGIALFFINLLMLYLTSWIVSDFNIDDFGSAIAATIIVWLVNTVLEVAFTTAARSAEA
jgi:putative membrane protein